MALTLLGVGAAGVIGMQRGTVHGYLEARNMDVATGIARRWMERLQADAAGWTTTREDRNPTLTGACFLSTNSDCNTGGTENFDTGWFAPVRTASASGIRYRAGANQFGKDVDSEADIRFCSQMQLSRQTDTLVQARVRVFWPKQYITDSVMKDSWCTTPTIDTNPGAYHAVYAMSALRATTR
jgi:Tfp pilus assembly protein PilV